jgi:hypothetical protein
MVDVRIIGLGAAGTAAGAPTGQVRIHALAAKGAATFTAYAAMSSGLAPLKIYRARVGGLDEIKTVPGGTIVVPPTTSSGLRLGIDAAENGDSLAPVWDDATAELGIANVHVRRLYVTGTQEISKHRSAVEGELRTQNILPWISVKTENYTNPNFTYSRAEAEILTWTLPACGMLLTADHEPINNNDQSGRAMTGAFNISNQQALIATCVRLQAAGKRVYPSPVANGYLWNIARSSRSNVNFNIKSWYSDALMAALEAAHGVMAADFYDNSPNPGPPFTQGTAQPAGSPGQKMVRFSAWCKGVGFDETGAGHVFQPGSATSITSLGAGEFGTYDLNNMLDSFAQAARYLQVACWWDRRSLGMELASVSPGGNPNSAAFKNEYMRRETAVTDPWVPGP